ncbi:MAG: hypothetical protein WAM91_03135 [Candidatus Acidiferrales bacterium]
MNRKYWLIFGVIQVIGVMGALCAMFFQFPSMLIGYFLLLLPGSLASVALYWRGNVGANWSLWALGGIAVITNVLLFATTSFLVTRYRKSK